MQSTAGNPAFRDGEPAQLSSNAALDASDPGGYCSTESTTAPPEDGGCGKADAESAARCSREYLRIPRVRGDSSAPDISGDDQQETATFARDPAAQKLTLSPLGN
jgi:hypothetical protein